MSEKVIVHFTDVDKKLMAHMANLYEPIDYDTAEKMIVGYMDALMDDVPLDQMYIALFGLNEYNTNTYKIIDAIQLVLSRLLEPLNLIDEHTHYIYDGDLLVKGTTYADNHIRDT